MGSAHVAPPVLRCARCQKMIGFGRLDVGRLHIGTEGPGELVLVDRMIRETCPSGSLHCINLQDLVTVEALLSTP